VLSAGLCVLALGALGSQRTPHDAFAPWVSFDAGGPARIEVTDASGKGALVRVFLVDISGHRVAQGKHALVISRAVPPGETLEIDLTRFWPDRFEGSLRIASNRPVTGRVRFDGLRYDFVRVQGPHLRFGVPERSDLRRYLVLRNTSASANRIVVFGTRAGERRTLAEFDVPAGGIVRASLPEWLGPEDQILVRGTTAMTGLLVIDDAGRWIAAGRPLLADAGS